jgi:hypothetical protein
MTPFVQFLHEISVADAKTPIVDNFGVYEGRGRLRARLRRLRILLHGNGCSNPLNCSNSLH